MELTDSLKTLFMETPQSLKGSARRLFMAGTRKFKSTFATAPPVARPQGYTDGQRGKLATRPLPHGRPSAPRAGANRGECRGSGHTSRPPLKLLIFCNRITFLDIIGQGFT